jgi:sugar O-acyltransferase (sialic acid O-acetyltransferase NeuD family)
MKHICVFLAFKNLEHIKLSFESIQTEDVDYYVLENPSENSTQIFNYFKNKNLIGYIRFNENVAANAVNTFIIDYKDLLLKYDYITITDGDIYVYDIKETFKEIKAALDNPNCFISSADLYLANNYDNNSNRVIGVDKYIEAMKINIKNFGSILGNTGNFLLTIKKENFGVIENIHYIDSNLKNRLDVLKKDWYKTNKNICYHLTWDLYVDNNPYYEWKKTVYPNIWYEKKEKSLYTIMLKEKVIIGAGGFAREIRAHVKNKNIKFFVSDEYYKENDENIHPLSSFDPNKYTAIIGVGDPNSKKILIDQLPTNTNFWTYISPNAKIIDDNIEIGEGSFICDGVIITTNVKLGKHVQLNLSTTVGHDTIIGDFFTSAPCVNISGNVLIGDFVYIGTNSVIKEKITITDDVIIGLNCGVVSNIVEKGVYVGTPQKKIK